MPAEAAASRGKQNALQMHAVLLRVLDARFTDASTRRIARAVCNAWRDAAFEIDMPHYKLLLKHKATIERTDGWAAYSTTTLPSGQLCACDSNGRRLQLLSSTGESHGTVQFENGAATTEARLLLQDPRCVCASAATSAMGVEGCSQVLFVADRSRIEMQQGNTIVYGGASRIVRVGLMDDGRRRQHRQFGPDARCRTRRRSRSPTTGRHFSSPMQWYLFLPSTPARWHGSSPLVALTLQTPCGIAASGSSLCGRAGHASISVAPGNHVDDGGGAYEPRQLLAAGTAAGQSVTAWSRNCGAARRHR